MKGFRGHAAGFMGHLIAHGGYRQGEIGMNLKQLGYPLDGEKARGIWGWRRATEVSSNGGTFLRREAGSTWRELRDGARSNSHG